MKKLRTHYDNLKVSRDAPDEVIRAAYRSLSQKYHPDRNRDDASAGKTMQIINAAYQTLSNPKLREEHDLWIAEQEKRFEEELSSSVEDKKQQLRFVMDDTANQQINRIWNLVRKGKSDAQIAEQFTKEGIINLKGHSALWSREQIAIIRRDFSLDTPNPRTIKTEKDRSAPEKRSNRHDATKEPQRHARQGKASSNIGAWISAVVAIFFLFSILTYEEEPSKKNNGSAYEPPPVPAFTAAPQVTPRNGEVKWYTNERAIAPLEIKTSGGSRYLIKLKDAITKQPVLTVYIRGGRKINLEVPLGTFEITYASGDTWYGYKHLFGPKTRYSKADETFSFRDVGYQVTGYTLTLYPVASGNLRTKGISANQF